MLSVKRIIVARRVCISLGFVSTEKNDEAAHMVLVCFLACASGDM
jgi:hypothetical protein